MGYIFATPLERFWAKVEKSPDCWVWAGARSGSLTRGRRTLIQYGSFYLGRDPETGRRTKIGAHVWSWQDFHGKRVPPGQLVLHRCDNGLCVRPSHLFVGTPLDNSRDMKAKGRSRGGGRGADSPLTKFTEQQVSEIKMKYAAGGVSQRALAREYGVSHTAVWSILNGQRWGNHDPHQLLANGGGT